MASNVVSEASPELCQAEEKVNRIETNQKAWSYLYQKVTGMEGWESRTAISDGRGYYTYSSFFANCRSYASVFSALSMTGEANARVGLVGSGAAETIFALYGLNMTGAEVSLLSILSVLKAERIMQAVKEEHLTDLIITDEFIQENTLRTLIQKKDELGLRFILLIHLPVCGCTVPSALTASFEQKTAYTRACWGQLYMDYLITVYGKHPVIYGENKSSDTAVIMHTSGTTGGSGKPVVMSDRALNSMSRQIAEFDGYDELKKDPACALMIDLSNVYGLAIQVHLPLSLGGKVATVPANGLNPFFFNVIPQEKISVLFCTASVIDVWMKLPGIARLDFSSLRCIILGGSSVSSEDKYRYLEFFTSHGYKGSTILNGYGISEMGGVCTLSSKDLEDESIGYLLKGINARFFDEDTGEYRTLADAPCTGVLYMNSDAMCTCCLDGKQIIRTETIDNQEYICTNDLVSADETGKLTYLGRANRYFLHKNGEKYQSGRVETEIGRQPGIKNCGIVPVFEKTAHDNIPMLCVSSTESEDAGAEAVRKAIESVFITEKALSIDNLPLQVLLADELPKNANGKLDIRKISAGEIQGRRFSVELTEGREGPSAIKLLPLKDDANDLIRNVYRGIAEDLMEESMPKKVAGNLRQFGSAFNPGIRMNPVQYAQTMNLFWQAYCYLFNANRNAGGNSLGLPYMYSSWQNNRQFTQMMMWLYNTWQSYNKNK